MAILLGSSWFDRRGEFVANLWGTLQVGAIGLVALTPLLAAMIGQATEGIPEEHVSPHLFRRPAVLFCSRTHLDLL